MCEKMSNWTDLMIDKDNIAPHKKCEFGQACNADVKIMPVIISIFILFFFLIYILWD